MDSFDEGGSERQALQLTRLLREGGKFDVSLASLKPEGVLRREVEKLQLGEVHSYPLTSFYDHNAVVQLRKFVADLRRNRIDVLHTHDFYTNVFGMAAGACARVKVRIASRRETTGLRTQGQSTVQRLAYMLAHHIVANSDAVRLKLIDEGLKAAQISVIPNGLDFARVIVDATRDESLSMVGAPGEASTLTHFVTIVANMRHEVKNYPMFLRAAARISKLMPGVGFLLAGEGELRPSLETLAVDLNIAHNTFFLGRCEKLAHLLNASDVCVLSSKAEGFSNSILEYMAAGRPVVATDVGGARSAIIEGVTGYLVPSGDDEAMARRTISLLVSGEKARAMGEAGKRLVKQKFSQQALLANTEELYARLLTERSSGTAYADTQRHIETVTST